MAEKMKDVLKNDFSRLSENLPGNSQSLFMKCGTIPCPLGFPSSAGVFIPILHKVLIKEQDVLLRGFLGEVGRVGCHWVPPKCHGPP